MKRAFQFDLIWAFKKTFRPKICYFCERYLISEENENWRYSSLDLKGKNCSMTWKLSDLESVMRIVLRHFCYPKGRLKPSVADKPVIHTSSPVSKRGSFSNLNSAIKFQSFSVLSSIKLVQYLFKIRLTGSNKLFKCLKTIF